MDFFSGFVHNFSLEQQETGWLVRCSVKEDFPIVHDWPDELPKSFNKRNVNLVLQSHQTVVFPVDDSAEELWPLMLASSAAAPLLLATRGVVVLHAAAIQFGNELALFLGGPGTGKSTLSLYLHQRGFGFASDNAVGIVVRHGIPEVLPGYPVIKLCADSATILGTRWSELPPWLSSTSKRLLSLSEAQTIQRPAKPMRLYFLVSGKRPKIQSVSRVDAVMSLVKQTFALPVLGILDPKRHFEAVSALARTCDAYTLCRGNSFDQLPEVARILEEHAGLSGPPAASHPA